MEKSTRTIEMGILVSLILLSSSFVIFGTGAVAADPIPELPGIPTGLTAEPGVEQVSLSWNAPASTGGNAIDYYVIYWQKVSSMDGGPFIPISSVNEIIMRVGIELPDHTNDFSAVITGLHYQSWSLDFRYSYNFSIAAHNTAGTGPQCIPTQANPYSISSISAYTISGNGQVNIKWELQPDYRGNGAPILYYVINQDGVDVMHTLGSSVYSATITGLTNGHTYNFSVAEHTTWGDFGQYNLTATPMAIPDAPTDLSATVGNGHVTLSWAAPANSGESFIKGYSVYQDNSIVADSPGTSITITGLTNNRTYSFLVAAHNSLNSYTEGLWSSPVQAAPTHETASSPSGLTSTPGDGKVDLSWSTPSTDGGAAIDHFTIYQNDTSLVNVTDNSATITGLKNNVSYSFAVSAHNYVGSSPRSNAILATPYTFPDAPTGLAVAIGNGQVTLSWNAPLFDGGRDIDYYIVHQDGVALPYHLTGPSTIISGLNNSQTYSFTVSAHNRAGIGPQSTEVTAVPSPGKAVPDAPTGLVATPGNAEVSLVWIAPSNNGGAPIDYYQVYVDGIIRSEHYLTTSTTITGLTNDQQYIFTIVAHNSVGEGSKSSATAVTPTAMTKVPGIPTGLTAMPGNTQISLVWTAPNDTGGAYIDYYVLYQDGLEISHTTTTSETVIGLTNGQSYNYTVAAHNSVGLGLPSSYTVASPSKTVPTEPLDVKAVSVDSGTAIELTWSEPMNDGGYALSSYSIFRSENSGGIELLTSIDPTVHLYVDRSVTLGESYRYRVQAINQLGGSPLSSGTSSIIAHSLVSLKIDTESSASSLGIVNVLAGQISTLASGQPLAGFDIDLSYSLNNGISWIDLSPVRSDESGSFSTSWIPTSSGVYLIKAKWDGSSQYPSASSTFNLAITLSSTNDVFTVRSNSTISNLMFNSVTKDLGFTVNGVTGTGGYTEVVISKELVSNGNDIKITIDAKEINYTLRSTATSWVLYFTYHHSSHDVVASLEGNRGTSSSWSDNRTTIIVISVVVAVALAEFALVYMKRRSKQK